MGTASPGASSAETGSLWAGPWARPRAETGTVLFFKGSQKQVRFYLSLRAPSSGQVVPVSAESCAETGTPVATQAA